MQPKDAKDYISEVSEELSLSEELIKDVIGFYYEKLRKSLSELHFHTIQVEELGAFQIKQYELTKLIDKNEERLLNIKQETYGQMAARDKLKKELLQAQKVQEAILQEQERKKQFKLKKDV